MSRSLKFRILDEEGLYYPCVEKKALISCAAVTAQLAADLWLYFRVSKNLVFFIMGLSFCQSIHGKYMMVVLRNDNLLLEIRPIPDKNGFWYI